MKMTILQAKQKLHEKWMKLTKDGTDEEMTQLLSIVDTVLGNYDKSLNADMVAMLTELQTEIDTMSNSIVEGSTITIISWIGMQKRIVKLIQSKIEHIEESQRFADAGKTIEPAIKSEALVSLDVYNQVVKERNIAIEQLHELGYEFGQKIASTTKNDLVFSKQAVLDLISDYDLSMGQVVKGIHNLQEPRCKNCKYWKDTDGKYRRGCDAESKCPINTHEVYCGEGYCYMFSPKEDMGGNKE